MKFTDFLRTVENDHPEFNPLIKEDTKNLSKEDALELIADFVKKVKEKFTGKDEAYEILKSAEKTLTFYMNELAPKDEDDDFASVSFIKTNFGPQEIESSEEDNE